ncbi:MAG: NAD-dependent epimerase/dehydratase family protein [Candidatus Marinimicrobia bacterium]|nr:NAD-dependent epimerase/dehydratase family protein [Candidatus Neomarinimicrobiota bacterium]
MNSTEKPLAPPAGALVLVTGATGFTGQVLTRQLAAVGCRVRALARPGANRAPLADLDLEWVTGQVYDPAAIAAAVNGCAYIFHVAAAYREAKLDLEAYRRVHVTSTRLLAEAAHAQPGFRRFVHVSTIGVHGDITQPPATETAPFAPGDDYQLTKAEGEQWIQGFAARTGLPVTVIRPAGIYGPSDRRLLKLFKMATWPVFPLLGFQPTLYHLIHVDDLAAALCQAAVHPAAPGEVFIIGNREPISIEAIGRLVADELGRPFRPVHLPAAPFFLAARLCEIACRPLHIEPPLYRRRVAFFTKQRYFDTTKMRTVLEFTPQMDNAEGLRATARAYLAQGWLPIRRAPALTPKENQA